MDVDFIGSACIGYRLMQGDHHILNIKPFTDTANLDVLSIVSEILTYQLLQADMVKDYPILVAINNVPSDTLLPVFIASPIDHSTVQLGGFIQTHTVDAPQLLVSRKAYWQVLSPPKQAGAYPLHIMHNDIDASTTLAAKTDCA